MGSRFLFLLIAAVFLASCGSSGEGVHDPSSGIPLEPQNDASPNMSVNGGIFKFNTDIEVEFSEGTFGEPAEITVGEKSDQETLDDYFVSAILFDGGKSLEKYIKVTSSVFPEKNILIRYRVPDDFLKSMGEEFIPRLFVKIFQIGADDEQLDYFEPLDFDLSGNILTASVQKEAFTGLRPNREGEFEAIFLLGSSPKKRVQMIKALGTKAIDTEASSDNTCKGATIGNPLETEPEVTSKFGPRILPPKRNPNSTEALT